MSLRSTEATEPQVVFRPSKKRKIYRNRAKSTDDDDVGNGEARSLTRKDAPGPSDDTRSDDAEDGLSVAEILRLRNARKSRLRGAGFKADSGAEETNTERSLVLKSGAGEIDKPADIEAITKRFAPQTGLVGELVNKHM